MLPQFHFCQAGTQNGAAIPKPLREKKLKGKETEVLKETVKILYFARVTKRQDHVNAPLWMQRSIEVHAG